MKQLTENTEKIDTSKIQGYLVGQVIVSVVGALLLLIGDFAGFYYSNYYIRSQTWGDIYFGSGFLATMLIIIGAGGLLFSLFFAVKTLRLKNKVSISLVKKNVKKSIIGGIFTAGLAGIGGLVFIISNVIDETEEWWLDSGFYGAFIGGLLVAFFGIAILNKVKSRGK